MALRVLPLLLVLLCAVTLLQAGVIKDDDSQLQTDVPPTDSPKGDKTTEGLVDPGADVLPFDAGFRRKRGVEDVKAKKEEPQNVNTDDKKTDAVSSPAVVAPKRTRRGVEDVNAKKVEPQNVNTDDNKTDAVSSPAVVPLKRTRRGVEDVNAKKEEPQNVNTDDKKTDAVSSPAVVPLKRTRRDDGSKEVVASPVVPQAADKGRTDGRNLETIPDHSRITRAAQEQSVRGAPQLSSSESPPVPVASGNKSKPSSPVADNKKTAESGLAPGKKPT